MFKRGSWPTMTELVVESSPKLVRNGVWIQAFRETLIELISPIHLAHVVSELSVHILIIN